MAGIRPAGFSDEDTDSDDYGFYEKPTRYYPPEQTNSMRKIEMNIQDAIINGNVKEVEKIIICDLNNNVNMKLDSGWTPLMHACFHAQHKIVHLLLDKGADPNLHADSVTPIMAACSNSSAAEDIIFDTINSLIEKGCILNIGDKYGQTPLMRAIGSGRVSVVQKLLDQKLNIEMRDQQGWTAAFWAIHHNQKEILEILIANGARLTEVDRSNRTLLDIAISHDYQDIIELLNKYLKNDEEDEKLDSVRFINNEVKSWKEFYPGLEKGHKPNYASEIPNLLYGMNCEMIAPLIMNSQMDLRSFLLMEEDDMIKLGIDMPYQRQRLKHGLQTFHMRGWKLNAVSGLYARKNENYSVLDCLTTLGSHLQQMYILEATLQYALRDYKRIQQQIKFEPPDSPLLVKMKNVTMKNLTNINSIRREMKSLKIRLSKISSNNPQPADLIKDRSTSEIVLGYVTEAVLVCSVALIAYNAKTVISNLIKK